MAEIVPFKKPANSPGLVHATCLLLGSRAILLRGTSGSGKSRLAGTILHAAKSAGRFACLVADDQIEIQAVNGRLLIGVPENIAGLREHAGIGILEEPYERRAIAGLVVDLIMNDRESRRMPDLATLMTSIENIHLARLSLQANAPGTAEMIMEVMVQLEKNLYRPETLSTIRVESLLHPRSQLFNDGGCGQV